MSEAERYESFVKGLEEKYPEMYHNVYCGISIDEGWFPIIEILSSTIYHRVKYVNQRREMLLKDNKYNQTIPEELKYPEVHQIKEKFGGLRFYYDGGDQYVAGMVQMAEIWASHTCEVCGERGTSRSGGWIKTLCDVHDKERKAAYEKRFANIGV